MYFHFLFWIKAIAAGNIKMFTTDYVNYVHYLNIYWATDTAESAADKVTYPFAII